MEDIVMTEKEKEIITSNPNYVKYVVDPYGEDMLFFAGENIDVDMLIRATARIVQVTYMALKSVEEAGSDARVYRETLQSALGDNEYWDSVKTIQEAEAQERAHEIRKRMMS